mmetsp:Transcript_99547/g.284583  ORF Transcript_99547/g.284583 Transcript_99547/m.284583 type:complete len:199 (-) Transcript_99547:71-667(-)
MMTGLAELKAGTTNETTVTTLDAEAVWPNQAAPVVPGSVASLSTPTVLQAGGFFVSVPGHPSKADGTVDLLVATSDEATEFSKRTISSYKKDNFYHHAEWLDMNNDGRLDVVAARCYEPQYVGKPDSELIWIEQPEDASADWETHVIYPNGPDVAFRRGRPRRRRQLADHRDRVLREPASRPLQVRRSVMVRVRCRFD